MLNLLQIVTEVCRRQGLPLPTAVVTSTSAIVQQLYGFANEVLDEVSARSGWQGVQIPTTFVGLNSYAQGNVFTMFPGFKWIKPDTFWDFTARIPVGGPMNDADWEKALALPFTGPFYRYRIFQNQLQLYPAPPPAPGQHTYAVEYQSENIIQQNPDSGPITVSKYWTADTDTPLIPDTIFTLGLRWRWRAEKGLPYLEHHKTYETVLNEFMGHDGGKPMINLADGRGQSIQPGVWVPAGNWPVSN